MDKALRQAGEAVRRKVLGDDYVDRALINADDFSRPFQDVLNEYCWGAAWTDDGLDLKQRSLLNFGMLAALNRMHEFGIYVRGAIRNGVSDDELRAALVQIAVYCGIPAGVEAFRVAGMSAPRCVRRGSFEFRRFKQGAAQTCFGSPEDRAHLVMTK